MGIRRTVILNVVGLTRRVVERHAPGISDFAKKGGMRVIQPVLPALTCPAQSSYLTGLSPSGHGIVGNGWYDRNLSEVHFWKQSNHLVAGKKLWEVLREEDPRFTCAKLFWWYNMYSTADFSVTPRPIYRADGGKIFGIYTKPSLMGGEMEDELGPFPFLNFWGPMAGLKSSQWIAAASRWMEERHAPTLQLVYLPHLDYNLQRWGPDHEKVLGDYREMDGMVADLISFFNKRHVQTILLSEYGISSVHRSISLNRLFRKKGWIAVRDERGCETLDGGASRVFAVADHQVAHVYVNDPGLMGEVRSLLEKVEGVEKIFGKKELEGVNLNHSRSGDWVVFAGKGSWFDYVYWLEDRRAPDFARTVDIHRKPGYDPLELFVDPKIHLPKIQILLKWLRIKAGFRGLMDVIPLDGRLIKGSHGRIPESEDEWPVLISDRKDLSAHQPCRAEEVRDMLLKMILG